MTDTPPAEDTEGRCGRTYPVPKRVTVSSTDRIAPVVPDSAGVRGRVKATLHEHDCAPDGSLIDGDAVVSCRCGETFTGWDAADGHVTDAVLAVVGQGVTVQKCRWCSRCQECGDYSTHAHRPAPSTTTEGA